MLHCRNAYETLLRYPISDNQIQPRFLTLPRACQITGFRAPVVMMWDINENSSPVRTARQPFACSSAGRFGGDHKQHTERHSYYMHAPTDWSSHEAENELHRDFPRAQRMVQSLPGTLTPKLAI